MAVDSKASSAIRADTDCNYRLGKRKWWSFSSKSSRASSPSNNEKIMVYKVCGPEFNSCPN